MRQGERHGKLVHDLVAQGFEIYSFNRRLACAIVERAGRPSSDRHGVRKEIRALFPRVADAFRIHREEMRVELAEVVVTSDLTRAKIEHIRALGAWLRGAGWALDVLQLDPYGGTYVEPWFELGTSEGLFRAAFGALEARDRGAHG